MHRRSDHAPGAENHHRKVWAERNLKYHLVPLPRHGQGHLPPNELTAFQPDLEYFQDGPFSVCLGNLGQCLTTLTGRNFFLTSNLNLSFLGLKLFLLVLPLLKVTLSFSKPPLSTGSAEHHWGQACHQPGAPAVKRVNIAAS